MSPPKRPPRNDHKQPRQEVQPVVEVGMWNFTPNICVLDFRNCFLLFNLNFNDSFVCPM